MIELKLVEDNLSKIKAAKFIILRGFPESAQISVIDAIIREINPQKEYSVEKFDQFNFPENQFGVLLQSPSMFEIGTIYVFFSKIPQKKISLLLGKENPNIFISFDDQYTDKNKKVFLLDYPKNISVLQWIKNYFNGNGLRINPSVAEYFASFFIDYTPDINSICENIRCYMQDNQLNEVTEKTIKQFLYLSNDYLFFQISDYFYKSEKTVFFNLYQQIIIQNQGFEKLFFHFFQEIKRLVLISELYNINHYSTDQVTQYLNDNGIKYTKFRLKYDLEKINRFSLRKLYDLLSFFIYCSYSMRRYSTEIVQNIFETYISSSFPGDQ